MPEKLDFSKLEGLRKHSLVMLSYSHTKNGVNYVKVKCDCSEEKIINWDNFTAGKVKSCGCARYKKYTPNINKHKLYRSWRNMRQRCNNKNNKKFSYYGGRGIKVCERWDSYENFYNDLIGSFKPGYQVDRIDTNGNYEPANCRMVTSAVNMQNRRDVKLTEEKVELIRSSGELHSVIAKRFNVTESHISRIKSGKTWK